MITTQTQTETQRGRGILAALILWPFTLTWRVAGAIEESAGILVTLLVGAAFVVFGLFFISTVLGIVIGAPMLFFGAMLVLRGLY